MGGLAGRQTQLEALVESLEEGLVLAEPDGRVIHWNRAALAMHDIDPDADVLGPLARFTSVYVLETLDGQTVPFEKWPLPRTIAGERVDGWVLRIRRLDGSWSRLFSYRGSLIPGADGHPLLVALHISDVTSLRALERSRARERELQDHLFATVRRLLVLEPEPGAVLAVAQTVLADAARLVRGVWQIRDGVGATLVEEVSGATSGDAEARVDLGEGWTMVARFTESASDRETQFAEALGGVLAVVFARERALASERGTRASLAESEAFLRFVIDQVDAAVWALDRNLVVRSVGGRTTDRIGVIPRDAIGKHVYDVLGDVPPVIREVIERARDGFTTTRNSPYLGRQYRSTYTPLLDSEGRPNGVLCVALDITEAVASAEAIRKLNAELEQRVSERTAELTAANRELEAFSYAVSHDLRAPLRAMSGFARALDEDFGQSLDSEAREYIRRIVSASRDMGALIDGLLQLSRQTRGDVAREQVDLSAIATRVLEGLTRSEPGRRAEWFVEPGLLARGDSRMLQVVLENLLGNAWKYSGKRDLAHIRFESEWMDGIRFFSVADDGDGFDESYADKLFKPFQRLHRHSEFPGIGIGLATVQRIVHRHGGEVRASGARGKGAVFRFSLVDHAAVEPANSSAREGETR